MGGRGWYSGEYRYLDLGGLERQRAHYSDIMRRNRIARQLDRNSDSAVIRRKQRAAERAYNAAETEVNEIDKAIARAKKRRRNNTPF